MIFKENSSKKKISTLGFGSWGLGSDSYGRINKNDSLKILNFATKKGINFIDTSNVYGKGLAEERIGEFLSKNFLLRPKLFIATKCGMLNNSSLSFSEKHDFNINNIERSIKKSLIRLRINYIDLIQLHSPPIKILKNKKKINQILKLFTKLKKIGVVKNFGVSVKSPQDALIIIKKYKQFNFIQLNFSLVDQRALEYGVLDAAYKNKVSIIARTPLAFGYLTGKVRVKKNDHRKKWGIKQANIWTKGRLKFSRAINRKKLSPTSLALLFATYHPAIKTVIPGMMKIKQVKDNIKFLKTKKLGKKEIEKLFIVYKSNKWIV
jgi:aryl-alcohol dehydrogenase-like predicted oxidoreductase